MANTKTDSASTSDESPESTNAPASESENSNDGDKKTATRKPRKPREKSEAQIAREKRAEEKKRKEELIELNKRQRQVGEMPEILINKIEKIPCDTVIPYDRNPRVGNVDAIAESLAKNRQYRPIIVQQSTRKILAGNHTWLAARKLGWIHIAATIIDVDDEHAKRIVLADNKTAELGGYDDMVMAELIASLDDTTGTGFSQDEVDMLIRSLPIADEMPTLPDESLQPAKDYGNKFDDSLLDDVEDGEIPEAALSRAGTYVDDTTDDEFDEAPEVEDVQLEKQPEYIPGSVIQLQDDITFETNLPFGIPPLLKDMLLPELPEDIVTWVDYENTPDDQSSTYYYVYGARPQKGLPWQRTIMSFFTFDYKFENWWRYPAKYVTKALHTGVQVVSHHDFSLWAFEPEAANIWNRYRSMWMARYMQEAGIRVIPLIQPGVGDKSLAYTTAGIPKKTPVITVQLQTIMKGTTPDAKDSEDPEKRQDYEDVKASFDQMNKIIDHIQPKQILIYTGGTGLKWLDYLDTTAQKVVQMSAMSAVKSIRKETMKQMEEDTYAAGKPESISSREKKQMEEHGIEMD